MRPQRRTSTRVTLSSSARIWTGIGLLLAFGAGGCSVLNAPSDHTLQRDAGPPGIAVSELCDQYAEAYCQAQQDCCTESDRSVPADCVSSTDRDCVTLYSVADSDDRLEYDPVAAELLLAEGQGYIQTCSPQFQAWLVSRDGFSAALHGTLPAGADCTPRDDSDPVEIVIAGLSCAGDRVCRDSGDGSFRCMAPGEDGEGCWSGFECTSGHCENESNIASLRGLCGPGEPDNERCAEADECASMACGWSWVPLGFHCQPASANAVYCPAGMR